MRRLMAITAFGLFLTIPVWAQRGGGGHGGGGFGGGRAGGFSAGHGGFAGHPGFSGGHVASGRFSSRLGGAALVSGSNRGFGRGPFVHDGFRGSRFRDHGFRNFGFRNCFGHGCWGYGYPWLYAGIDPWWWDSGSSYDQDYERDRELADEMNAQNLREQQMLRQEQADRDQDAYARPPRRELEKSEPEAAVILPATVLVFRDRHKQEVQNYAIVGQTLWAFAPQHNQKIPLADLDLVATAKANDDRGVTFRVPSANEAQ